MTYLSDGISDQKTEQICLRYIREKKIPKEKNCECYLMLYKFNHYY